MLIDHTGAVFDLPIEFRVIGRIAFPLFVYLIAEGCHHTKSMEKYLLRLGIFAFISEVPFDLALQGGNIDFLNNTNIFYTLFLGALSVYAFQKIRYFAVLPLIAAMGAAIWLGSDYSWMGVLFIFLMAVLREIRHAELVTIAAFMILLYAGMMVMLVGSMVSVLIVALANGEKGLGVKWLFYFIYPGHLLLLAVLAGL